MYVFLTQFKTYFRNNPSIDDSAILTANDPYHDLPFAVIKDKNEKDNTWFELSIYYKRNEMLVTGDIIGEKRSNQLNPFLGPGIPFTNMASNSQRTTNHILVRDLNVAFTLRERNLRSWTKNSSSFEWAAVSKRFAEKGFQTPDQHRQQQSQQDCKFDFLCVELYL